MKLKITFTLSVFVLFALIAGIAHAQSGTPQANLTEANRAMAALNTWRAEQGLWLLAPDPTLTAMALDQARYLLSLPQMPSGGAIHDGRTGESPRERAVRAPYYWVSYGNQIIVNEIGYVGASVEAAIRFWRGSDIHSRTVSNPLYRQIGVAAVAHPFGHLYIVVVGAQPNVLPALVDVPNGRLYLSNDRVSGSQVTWVQNATQVRLFDALGRPLQSEWQPWALTVPLPQGVGDRVFVAYTDGRQISMTQVDFNADAPLPIIAAAAPTAVAGLPAAPITPTVERTLVANVPAATSAPATPITQGTLIPPPSAAGEANVLLIYNARTLTLQNIGASPIAVRELELHGGGVTFLATFWQTQWLSGSLESLAPRDCLQVWAWTEADGLPQESACRQRRGAITVSPDRMLWRTHDIDVIWRNTVLTTCPRQQTTCAFRLPNLNDLQSGSSLTSE